jgi:hypothetical protein
LEVDVFFFPFIGNMERGGGKVINLRALEMFFFIVERLGRDSAGVIFFTNSLWDGRKGAP